MVYQDLVLKVSALDFIKDDKIADSAIKAVFGIMLSSMREEDARNLAQMLPVPLSLERLRGHQKRHLRVTPDYYITEIALQFRLTHDQAEKLVSTILRHAKGSLPEDTVIDWESHLPADVAEVVRGA